MAVYSRQRQHEVKLHTPKKKESISTVILNQRNSRRFVIRALRVTHFQ